MHLLWPDDKTPVCYWIPKPGKFLHLYFQLYALSHHGLKLLSRPLLRHGQVLPTLIKLATGMHRQNLLSSISLQDYRVFCSDVVLCFAGGPNKRTQRILYTGWHDRRISVVGLCPIYHFSDIYLDLRSPNLQQNKRPRDNLEFFKRVRIYW